VHEAISILQGYGAPNLDAIVFREGNNGSKVAQIAFNRGHPAITIDNIVHVRGDKWAQVATPRSGNPAYFEEILHAIQWGETGKADFAMSYLKNAFISGLLADNMHHNPAERQAVGLSRRLMRGYQASGKRCPD
jgi:hypothetical protein